MHPINRVRLKIVWLHFVLRVRTRGTVGGRVRTRGTVGGRARDPTRLCEGGTVGFVKVRITGRGSFWGTSSYHQGATGVVGGRVMVRGSGLPVGTWTSPLSRRLCIQ